MYRLMIADDEDDERMGIKFLMKKCGFGFDITEAADGREALEKLKESAVDILFTDDFDYVKQALSLQAVDYILKPVNPEEFEKTIRLVVERMEQKNALLQQNQQAQKSYILSRLLNKMPYDKLKGKYLDKYLAFLEKYTRMILMEFEDEFFGNRAEDIYELQDKIREQHKLPFDMIDLNPSQGILLLKGGAVYSPVGRERIPGAVLFFRQSPAS